MGKTMRKTKRDLKAIGDLRFLSPSQPYFVKQDKINGLIFTFRNQTDLRGFPDRKPANGAQFGLVSPHGTYPLIPEVSEEI